MAESVNPKSVFSQDYSWSYVSFSKQNGLLLSLLRYLPDIIINLLVFLGMIEEVSRTCRKADGGQTGDNAEVGSFPVDEALGDLACRESVGRGEAFPACGETSDNAEVESSPVSDGTLVDDPADQEDVKDVKNVRAKHFLVEKESIVGKESFDLGQVANLAGQEDGTQWGVVAESNGWIYFDSKKPWSEIRHQADLDFDRMQLEVEGVCFGGPVDGGERVDIDDDKVTKLCNALQQERGMVGVACGKLYCPCEKPLLLEARSIIERWMGAQGLEEENQKAALEMCSQAVFPPVCDLANHFAAKTVDPNFPAIQDDAYRLMRVNIEGEGSSKVVVIRAESDFLLYTSEDIRLVGLVRGCVEVRVPAKGSVEVPFSCYLKKEKAPEGWEMMYASRG